MLTDQRQYTINLVRCGCSKLNEQTRPYSFPSYAEEIKQLLSDIVLKLTISNRACAILQHHQSQNFLKLFGDPTRRLKITNALVHEQLHIEKTIPAPDPFLKYDWTVRNQLMGKRLHQLYTIWGPGFQLHHQVPDADLKVLIAFQEYWSSVNVALPVFKIIAITSAGLRKRERKRMSKSNT